MNARARGLAKGTVLLGMLAGFVAINAPAQAGSDSPTPYTVTADGITLPAGTTFPAHGHVNWRTSWAQHGVHFDPNNGHHGAKYIGQSFIPFNLEPGECVTWVQVSLYDEHYGQGGQDPICKPTTTPTEEPTWTPEPTPSPSSEPSTTPTKPSEPSPQPSTTPSEPATPGTTPSEDTPPSTSEPQPEPTGTTPEQPSTPPTAPGPTPETPSEPSATPDPTEPTTTPAPIQCDPGYAPGWLDENGHPTGCVWNGTTYPEPEETPWTPTPLPTAPSVQQPSVTPSEPSSAPGTTSELPPETAGQSPTTPGAQPPPPSATSATPAPPSLAVTGSNDPLIGVVAGLFLMILGLNLAIKNYRRKP